MNFLILLYFRERDLKKTGHRLSKANENWHWYNLSGGRFGKMFQDVKLGIHFDPETSETYSKGIMREAHKIYI